MDQPFGADVVPAFETLWYSMATLAPLEPAQEEVLRPLTRYLRGRGKALSAADLIFAQAYLQVIVRGAWKVLNDYDVVLTPTLAQPPAPVGYFEEVDPAENFERQKRFTPFTAVYNVTGQPAVNLPLYWTDAGLPIGVMLAGRMRDEGTLISLSAQVEAARPWKDRHPPIWSD
jgi:amidase